MLMTSNEWRLAADAAERWPVNPRFLCSESPWFKTCENVNDIEFHLQYGCPAKVVAASRGAPRMDGAWPEMERFYPRFEYVIDAGGGAKVALAFRQKAEQLEASPC